MLVQRSTPAIQFDCSHHASRLHTAIGTPSLTLIPLLFAVLPPFTTTTNLS